MSAPKCPIVSEDPATQAWFYWRWLEAQPAPAPEPVAAEPAAAAQPAEPEPPAAAPEPAAEPEPEPQPEPQPSLKDRITTFLVQPKNDLSWAATAADLLILLENHVDELRADPEFKKVAQALVAAANADCNFAHCYLSVAMDIGWMLRGL